MEGVTLQVLDVDMVDATPVLDIKPYVAYTDAHPDSAVDWLERSAGDLPADPIESYTVCLSPVAREQLEWIQGRSAHAPGERIRSLLSADPFPRPYRRIRRERDGFVMAVGEWRVRSRVEGRQVEVDSL
ncbi:MAG: TrmO family methyltransferase, partial [Gammaproteobacteria bacterium]